MKRNDLDDLHAFSVVARERSFSRAAAQLGLSPSALSQAVRKLEGRLGHLLLVRTTRSVMPSEQGERLLRVLAPALDRIDEELVRLRDGGERPVGTLRLTTFSYAATTVLAPALPAFMADHPGISVEVSVDAAPVDIVASRFSAGIRFADDIDRDMVAIRVAPDVRSLVVATPGYLARHGVPASPDDLGRHACIGLRMPRSGGLHPWTFHRDGRTIAWPVQARLVTDDSDFVLSAALSGQGLAYRLAPQVDDHLASGRLVSVLDDWSATTKGLHLYHPPHHQAQPALQALVEALRLRPT